MTLPPASRSDLAEQASQVRERLLGVDESDLEPAMAWLLLAASGAVYACSDSWPPVSDEAEQDAPTSLHVRNTCEDNIADLAYRSTLSSFIVHDRNRLETYTLTQ